MYLEWLVDGGEEGGSEAGSADIGVDSGAEAELVGTRRTSR